MVATGLTSQGQGHETVFAQIVADELGVDVADVYVTTGDTRRFPYAVGTYASRAAVMSGNAVALAARAVRAKAVRIAADALEAAPDDLEHRRRRGPRAGHADPGHPAVAGGGAVEPAALLVLEGGAGGDAVRLARPTRTWPRCPTTTSPGSRPATTTRRCGRRSRRGCTPRSSRSTPTRATSRSLRYAVVHDCGPLINPMLVEGQIHGGVAQGVAGALLERLAYDEAGNLLQRQLHGLPDAVPERGARRPRSATWRRRRPLNPLGIKGAGEAGVIPGSACLAAAIEDAVGVRIDRMPISPARAVGAAGRRRRGREDVVPGLGARRRRGRRSATRPAWPPRCPAPAGAGDRRRRRRRRRPAGGGRPGGGVGAGPVVGHGHAVSRRRGAHRRRGRARARSTWWSGPRPTARR